MTPVGSRAFVLLVCLAACGGNSSGAGDAGRDGAGDNATRDGAAERAEGGQAAPGLTAAAAWRSGASGDDVALALEGADPDGDIVRIAVRFLDEQGSPLNCFDTDADGVPDSSEGSARIDTPLGGKASFAGSAWLNGILQWCPGAAGCLVWLEDAGGRRSEEREAAVAPQTELGTGAGCSPTLMGDRCSAGLACTGQPPTCAPAVAPVLTRLAYLQLATGVRIAVDGTDESHLLARLSLDFLDAAGAPVSVDQDGDGIGDGTTMDAACAEASHDGLFAFTLWPAGAFGSAVKRLQATPMGGGLSGPPLEAKLTAVATRGIGAACDYAGFDACASNYVCSPGIKGKVNTCLGLSAARGKKNTGAPVLSPAGKLRASGLAEGTSLWDAPSGCQPNDPVGTPEGVAILHLTAAQAELTLTTDLPGTAFDTALYVVKDYAGSVPTVLGCNDDGPASPTSTLTLRDLVAGDYLIVVDSFTARAGNFEVRIVPGP